MTIDIPPEQGLAMKADLAISWNKLRVIRRLNDSCMCMFMKGRNFTHKEHGIQVVKVIRSLTVQ